MSKGSECAASEGGFALGSVGPAPSLPEASPFKQQTPARTVFKCGFCGDVAIRAQEAGGTGAPLVKGPAHRPHSPRKDSPMTGLTPSVRLTLTASICGERALISWRLGGKKTPTKVGPGLNLLATQLYIPDIPLSLD